MLKNMIRILNAIVGCIAIVVSPYACAEVLDVPVEITCSESFIDAPWVTFNGQQGVQYTLTTSGIRDTEMGTDVVKVINTGLFNNETPYGLSVHVVARCIPGDNGKYMSSTGATLK